MNQCLFKIGDIVECNYGDIFLVGIIFNIESGDGERSWCIQGEFWSPDSAYYIHEKMLKLWFSEHELTRASTLNEEQFRNHLKLRDILDI